jgi:predicted acyl esterase
LDLTARGGSRLAIRPPDQASAPTRALRRRLTRHENAGMGERRSWIPMEDGVRLAASLFLPESGEPAPVVLEALPYRKDDATASYRPEYERLCGEYGYAVARVDLRGTGSSEGSPPTSTRPASRPISAR